VNKVFLVATFIFSGFVSSHAAIAQTSDADIRNLCQSAGIAAGAPTCGCDPKAIGTYSRSCGSPTDKDGKLSANWRLAASDCKGQPGNCYGTCTWECQELRSDRWTLQAKTDCGQDKPKPKSLENSPQ
jgi:hypothetical protein